MKKLTSMVFLVSSFFALSAKANLVYNCNCEITQLVGGDAVSTMINKKNQIVPAVNLGKNPNPIVGGNLCSVGKYAINITTTTTFSNPRKYNVNVKLLSSGRPFVGGKTFKSSVNLPKININEENAFKRDGISATLSCSQKLTYGSVIRK